VQVLVLVLYLLLVVSFVRDLVLGSVLDLVPVSAPPPTLSIPSYSMPCVMCLRLLQDHQWERDEDRYGSALGTSEGAD